MQGQILRYNRPKHWYSVDTNDTQRTYLLQNEKRFSININIQLFTIELYKEM